MKRLTASMAAVVFLIGLGLASPAYAQMEAAHVMTLANGAQINLTPAQLSALVSQPGITISGTPVVAAGQVAIPVPASMGGGFMVAEPAALASGLNTIGATMGATPAGVAGATASAGAVTAGASVGAAVAGGISAGTIAVGAAAAAAVAGGVAAAASSDSTTNH